MISLQAPDVGSIVGCWFPYSDKEPLSPGPDFRPCLVLQVIKRIDKKAIQLVVCYGTGQTTDSNKISMNKSSFEVEKGDGNNLAETTKFDVKNVAVLPLEDRFFGSKKSPLLKFSRVGQLTEQQEKILLEKVKSSGIKMDYSPHPTTCIITRKK